MRKARVPAAVAAVSGVLFAGALAVDASVDEPVQPARSDQTVTDGRPPAPPDPEWVNPDGTVDMSKMPDSMPLIGPDGEVVKNADGDPVKVDTSGGLKPSGPTVAPSPKPGESRTSERDADGRMTEKVEVSPSVPPAN